MNSQTPNVYNVTLTNADQEYSQVIPDGTKRIEFRARTSAAIRFAFATGKVAGPTAPYLTIPANGWYGQDGIYLEDKTLYLASSSAGTVVELICWT